MLTDLEYAGVLSRALGPRLLDPGAELLPDAAGLGACERATGSVSLRVAEVARGAALGVNLLGAELRSETEIGVGHFSIVYSVHILSKTRHGEIIETG